MFAGSLQDRPASTQQFEATRYLSIVQLSEVCQQPCGLNLLLGYRRLSSFTVTFHQEFHPGADRADLHQSNIRMSPRVGAPVDLQLESNNHPELIITSSLPPPCQGSSSHRRPINDDLF